MKETDFGSGLAPRVGAAELARLEDAWNEIVQRNKAMKRVTGSEADEADAALRRIAFSQPRNIHGLITQLRVAGQLGREEKVSEQLSTLLANALTAAESFAMTAVVPRLDPAPARDAAFDDGLSAFERITASDVVLPTVLSDDMARHGALRAGTSPSRIRQAYEAIVQRFGSRTARRA
jgi:hypothetical protein